MNFVYWVRGKEFADMAAISAASVKRVYPAARVFVYTDAAHDSLKNSVFNEVLMVPAFNFTRPMLANLQAQVHYCLSHHFTAPTAFLDADILAVKPIDLPKNRDWDLIVTQRDHVGLDDDGNKVVGVAREMPYNYGVLLANNTTGGNEAMIALRNRLAKFGQARQDWYGNQWALRELVGGTCFSPTPRTIQRKADFWLLNIEVRDCHTWNYTPQDADEDFSEKFFVHVKGNRKELFKPIAEKLAC